MNVAQPQMFGEFFGLRCDGCGREIGPEEKAIQTHALDLEEPGRVSVERLESYHYRWDMDSVDCRDAAFALRSAANLRMKLRSRNNLRQAQGLAPLSEEQYRRMARRALAKEEPSAWSDRECDG